MRTFSLSRKGGREEGGGGGVILCFYLLEVLTSKQRYSLFFCGIGCNFESEKGVRLSKGGSRYVTAVEAFPLHEDVVIVFPFENCSRRPGLRPPPTTWFLLCVC